MLNVILTDHYFDIGCNSLSNHVILALELHQDSFNRPIIRNKRLIKRVYQNPSYVYLLCRYADQGYDLRNAVVSQVRYKTLTVIEDFQEAICGAAVEIPAGVDTKFLRIGSCEMH